MPPLILDQTLLRERRAVTAVAERSAGEASWALLVVVVAAHAVLLGGLAAGMSRPEPVTPPTVVGMLVSAPPPSVEPPKPLPVAPEPPRPRPVVRKPTPLPPIPNAPPSERAVAAPPPELQAAPETAPPPVAPPAPPAPPAPAPVEAQAPVVPPRTDASHLNNPLPVYPNISRRLGEQGKVLFDVYILPDGSVGEIKLKKSSGFDRLDKAAQDAISRWRYVPARRGDTPIPYWYVQPFTWALDS